MALNLRRMARMEALPTAALSGAKREKSRHGSRYRVTEAMLLPQRRIAIRIAAAHSRCRPQKSNLAPVLPSCRISVGQTPSLNTLHLSILTQDAKSVRSRDSAPGGRSL